VNRRDYLETAGVTVTASLFAGCSSSTDSGSTDDGSGSGGTTYGTLATSVTDQPSDIADFESLVVTIEGIWVKPAGDDGTDAEAEEESETESTGTEATETAAMGTESMNSTEMEAEAESMETETDGDGRRYIEFEESQDADLVQLQGGNSKLIDETEVETGEYQFLQLDVAGTDGTLTDGSEADVETPGNAPLKFNAEFEVREDERTTFVADFTPVQRGNGSYIIRPVASGTTVLYGDAEYTAADASTATGSDGTEAGDDTATATDGGTEMDGSQTETDRPGNGGGNGNS